MTDLTTDFLTTFGGPRSTVRDLSGGVQIAPATSVADRDAYHRLRRETFVGEQGVFDRDDRDELDDHPHTVVLVARDRSGTVVGGVRLTPAPDAVALGQDLAWWQGSRLAVRPGARRAASLVGTALVRAACARAEQEGALRFDAHVQLERERYFSYLGWQRVRPLERHGRAHVLMRWPVDRIAAQARTKSAIGTLFAAHSPGARSGPGWVGDDGVPVPGTDTVAVTDAIVPAMVERDPRWAGWCAVLVNVNDLTAMGATPLGLLDALGVPTESLGRRVVDGMMAAADAWDVPLLGGHTQVGVPASLSITMLGRTATPIGGGHGRPGDELTIAADLRGGWRSGYTGRQWDSTTAATPDELRHLQGAVGRAAPRAAKDISMAGLVGTVGMLAEASGCGATLRIADVPRPRPGAMADATLADWLTCFPGYGMVLADAPGRAAGWAAELTPATTKTCGSLTPDPGVLIEWPDGETVPVLAGPVTGLGRA